MHFPPIFFEKNDPCRLLVHQPQEFSLETPRGPAAHQHFTRLMLVIQFSFQNLGSTHANVARLARRVFTLAARHTAADTPTFNQVWELLGALDATLQMRLRKGLAAAIEELYLGAPTSDQTTATFDGSTLSSLLSSSSSEESKAARTPQELDRSAFLEKFLNECSNQHTEMVFNNSGGCSWSGLVIAKKRGWRPPLMRSTSHSPSRQLAMSSRSSSRSPSRANTAVAGSSTVHFKPQLKPSLCQSVYNINNNNISGVAGPTKRPTGSNNLPWNSGSSHSKPRVLSRLAQKSRLHELAREVLPKFDLSFLTNTSQQHNDDERMEDDERTMMMMNVDQDTEMSMPSRPHSVAKSRSMTRLATASSRNVSPTKGLVGGGCGGVSSYYASNSSNNNWSPSVQRKRGGSRDSGMGSTAMTSNTTSSCGTTSSTCSRTPQSSPLLLHRDKRSGGGCGGGGGGSCKDLVAYEESLALALALSKSIYHETPLPVIPGLSAQKLQQQQQQSHNLSSQEVLAHPHRDVSTLSSS